MLQKKTSLFQGLYSETLWAKEGKAARVTNIKVEQTEKRSFVTIATVESDSDSDV